MSIILDLLYSAVFVCFLPKVIYRRWFHNRYKEGWAERFGAVRAESSDRKSIWIHAVSVGEANAAKTIVDQLEKRYRQYRIVISCTTDTGYERAKILYGDRHSVIYFPLDFSFAVRSAFKKLSPAVCVLMELEIWPNFVYRAQKNNVPIIVVNGRISDRGFKRYKKAAWVVRPIFSRISKVLCQSREYAERFIYLGSDPNRTLVCNSLKYDTAQTEDRIEGAEEAAALLKLSGRRIWTAGATGPGEEKMILEVFGKLGCEFKDLAVVIVPRKPERFNETAKLIKAEGFEYIRYSLVRKSKQAVAESADVILGDTMGDLRKFYAISEVVFTGRSLVPMGGSDMMEPAAMGKCTVFGPYTFNFKQTVKSLLEGNGAVEVQDADELYRMMRKCLSERAFAEDIGSKGQQIIKDNQGGTGKTVEEIAGLIN